MSEAAPWPMPARFTALGRMGRAACVAAGLAIAALPARAETLADALVDVYNSSGLLEQNRALLRAADEDVAGAVSTLRPILDWTTDITRTYSRSKSSSTGLLGGGGQFTTTSTDLNLGITGSLLLYDFGRSDLTIAAARETVLATRQTLLSVEQQVLFRGVQAYMNVIRNREFVALRKNNLRLLQEELRAARDRFEVGEVTRTDVAQAEAAVANARSGLASAKGDLTRAEEEFRAAAGRKPGQLRVPAKGPSLGADVGAARAVAMRRHPDLLRAQHDVAAADRNVQVAEAAVKPRLELQGSYGYGNTLLGNPSYGHQGSVGVQLSGPIYHGGQLSAQRRRAIAQRDAQRGQLHLVRLQVAQNVGNAYADLRAARASRDASREQVRAATVAFNGMREEAKLGARTTLDVLSTEQDLLDAQATLISASADVTIAAYAVLSSMGELTVKSLNLPVTRYDPAAYYNLAKDAPVRRSKRGQKLERVLKALGKN